MPQFDGMPRETTGSRADQDGVVEALPPLPPSNLVRGIVWADILADIAADEEARRLRDAA